MTLAEFIQKLVALGASPPVIAVTVEYVTERDASRIVTRDGSVTQGIKRQQSAIRSRNYRASRKRDGSVTGRDALRDGARDISSSSFLPSVLASEESGNREESKKEVVAREADDWPADHETIFWKAYPRKVGRKQARAKMRLIRQRREVTFAKLMAAVNRYAIACKSIEPQFVKHPATWLNAGCWDDEHMPEASNGYRGPRPLQDDSKSISAAAGRLAEAAERGEFAFGPRPSLLPEPNENPVFLLSKG
jgi:hypothetical protein